MSQHVINFDVTGFLEASKTHLNDHIVDCHDLNKLTQTEKENAIALIVRLGLTLNKKILQQFPNIKCIGTMTTGLDHIDIAYCDERNIKVISLKGEVGFLKSIRATPELTWSLILSLMRNLTSAIDSTKNGNWSRQSFYGHDLKGKTIGIIGLGRVGQILARYAKAFDMTVLAFDQTEDAQLEDVTRVDLESLLKKSDIVSLHLSLTNQTREFIKSEHFELMKNSAIFINTARGGIVDESAFLKALKENKIRAAGIDVIDAEVSSTGVTSKHPLIQYAAKNSNLIITPHIAGSTYESMESTANFIADKVQGYLDDNK
ncbi:hypothetical protein BVY03_03365 [bacterium K02(2017)]|nr:hypothetical protein BVY03_03365 [bacterium K02(2017)]